MRKGLAKCREVFVYLLSIIIPTLVVSVWLFWRFCVYMQQPENIPIPLNGSDNIVGTIFHISLLQVIMISGIICYNLYLIVDIFVKDKS